MKNQFLKTKYKKTFILGMIVTGTLALQGCGSSSSLIDKPVGIGSGPNMLKSSPCACFILENEAQTSERLKFV